MLLSSRIGAIFIQVVTAIQRDGRDTVRLFKIAEALTSTPHLYHEDGRRSSTRPTGVKTESDSVPASIWFSP
jgi:hypothetical protein